MKRLVAILMLGLAFGVQAQNSAVNKAESKLKEGAYQEAMELITPALEHEKTMDKGRTWFINGNLYKDIALSEDPEVQALATDAVEKAVDSYKKVLTLEKESSAFYQFATFAMDEIWAGMINKGAAEFENDDLAKALEFFTLSKLARPNDTTSLLYSGVAAQSIEKYDVALNNYEKLIEQGYYNEEVYGSMFYIQRSVNEDNDAALAILREAIEKFPDNEDFKSLEIELLVSMDMIDDAIAKLEEKIAEDPTDPILFFSLGYMYDEMEEEEKAMANYQKAVELKPDYYEANVNLAIVYYNKAIVIYKDYNNLSMDDYKKKGPAMEAEAKELMEKSLPYWLAAHEARPEARAAIENLQNVYVRLKMYEKSEEMRKKLEALDNN